LEWSNLQKLRIVFAGTPDFACPSLVALQRAGHGIDLVVTQPDRPRGRGRHLAAPAVKTLAGEYNLPLLQPERIDAPGIREQFEALAPDVVVVVAFGQKIPSWLLCLAPLGCLNVHASLLPAHRGAAPIQRAILEGLPETGVTIMQLDEGWDTGPLLGRRPVAIGPDEDAGSLRDRLAEAGAGLLVEVLAGLAEGSIAPVAQNDALATRAPKIGPEEARMDWRRTARELHNLARALSPAPLAETSHRENRLQIMATKFIDANPAGETPGTVLAVDADGIVVSAGKGKLRLVRVKPANGRAMPAADYARGHRLAPGERLD
jgi:methionyl-tRNA formyltransferase